MPLDLARASAITGWMDQKELRWLARVARTCQIIVEIGSYQGRSTRALADHCPGVVYAVDPWAGGYLNDDGTQAKWIDTRAAFPAFQANLADHLASGHVVALVGTLEQVMPNLEKLGVIKRGRLFGGKRGQADMVFIDADHRYEMVKSDIALARKLVRPGGIIAGHDFGHPTWPAVKRAVDEEFGENMSQLCRMIWWVQTKEKPEPEPVLAEPVPEPAPGPKPKPASTPPSLSPPPSPPPLPPPALPPPAGPPKGPKEKPPKP